MESVQVYVLNAFSDGEIGGNPAGVVPNAERFDHAAKQLIAAEVGLSETAFISPSQTADFKLEFFTPTLQIPDCGHATVAAFAFLRDKGLIDGDRSSKEIQSGTRAIGLEDGSIFMDQTEPTFKIPEVDPAETLAMLGLGIDDLMPDQKPIIVSTGVPYLLIPLKDARTVAAAEPDFSALKALGERLDVWGFYPFSTETRQPGRVAGARMFGPGIGINEESATGMAAGPLACFLRVRLGLNVPNLVIEQGVLMSRPSPSLLEARFILDGVEVRGVRIGGTARVAEIREVRLSAEAQIA